MSPTEVQLVAVHGAAVPLREVCEPYLGLTYVEASRRAALNELGVPTFKLRDSQKAPLLIKAADLAALIDKTAEEAHASWKKSQV